MKREELYERLLEEAYQQKLDSNKKYDEALERLYSCVSISDRVDVIYHAGVKKFEICVDGSRMKIRSFSSLRTLKNAIDMTIQDLEKEVE
jgi:hypothetical protein